MGEKPDLEAIAADVGRTSALDRLSEVVTESAAIVVPVVGPVLALALRQLMPRDQDAWAHGFAAEAAKRIGQLDADKLDRRYLASDAFAEDLGTVLDSVTGHRNRAKREHYVAALRSCATTDRPVEVERHRFLDALDQLRPSQLRLLGAMRRAGSLEFTSYSIEAWFQVVLQDPLLGPSEVDLVSIKLDWEKLRQHGVLGAMPDTFPTDLWARDRVISGLMWDAISDFGHRFADFLELETAPGSPGAWAPDRR